MKWHADTTEELAAALEAIAQRVRRGHLDGLHISLPRGHVRAHISVSFRAGADTLPLNRDDTEPGTD
jgi:hypothetical protein